MRNTKRSEAFLRVEIEMMKIICAVLALAVTTGGLFAQSNYRLKPGDTITVEVLEDPQLNRTILVLPDGSINFPFAGSVPVGGRSLTQVEAAIRSGISRNFASDPTVFVNVTSVRENELLPETEARVETIDIYFTGEVNNQGLLPVRAGTTFLQAVAQSGGFTRFAATKRVQLRRLNRKTQAYQTYTMNFKALERGSPLVNDVVLQEGDVILVPERRLFE